MMTQPTQPGTTPDESTTVSRDLNRVGPAAENQGHGGGESAADAGHATAGEPTAAHGRHRAPTTADADDPRAGGHPERAARSLRARELVPADGPIAGNAGWHRPERLRRPARPQSSVPMAARSRTRAPAI